MKNVFLILAFSVSLIIESFPQSFSTGKIGVTLSGAGRVRVFKDSTSGLRQIDRSSILVGVNPSAVFGYNQDAQNAEPVVSIQNPLLSDFEVYGAADNSYNDPPLPPNVVSKANIYGWISGGYIVAKFTVLNKETNPIDAVLGMEIIPQVNGSYGLESMKWLSSEQILSIYRIGETNYTGYKILSSQTNSVRMIDWYDGYDTVDTDLWGWITGGIVDTAFDSGGDGSVNFIAQNAVNIPAGDSAYFWVGISVGESESEMINSMVLAQQKYDAITSIKPISNLAPLDYSLEQNYPNPFNPETSIQFSIPKRNFVSLSIYNLLGKETSILLNQELDAGTYSIKFNGNNYPSGVYYYTIKTETFTQTKKMMLLK